MRRWRSVLVVLVLATTASAAGEGDELRAAREAKAQGRFAEAIEHYHAAAAAAPDDPVLLGELAQVLSWDGQFDAAVDTYRRALEIEPDADALRLGLARTYSWDRRFDESLRIYEAYLEDHPGDDAAWFEATKVRSWDSQYAAAVDAYRAHLADHPDDRAVRLELAKVLSWAQRYDESVEEYRRLLADGPDDREARLGLARALSWSGRYDEAMQEYGEMLSRHPDDAEAQVGLARTLAWSGNLAGAEARYDAILSGRPQDAQALLGKAQIAYWQGNAKESERLLARAEAAAPGEPDIEAFRGELRELRRPFLDSDYQRVQDTDGNDWRSYRLFLTLRPTVGFSLTPYYTHTEAYLGRDQFNSCVPTGQQGDRATVDSLGIRFGWALPRGVGLLVGAGVDRSEPSVGGSSSRGVGSVVAFGRIGDAWKWRASAERRTFDATRVIVDCALSYDALTGGLDGTWKKWRFGGGAGFTDFSDGNGRVHVDLSATRPLEVAGQRLELGYRFRYMSYDENLADGYFDPQSFLSNLLVVSLRGKLFIQRLDYALLLSGGLQSFEEDPNTVEIDGVTVLLPGSKATNDTVFGWEVRIGWNITARARVEAYYGETDYAAQSATGFQSEASGLLFRYRF